MLDLMPIIIGAVGGGMRSLIGYLKAHFKHQEKFHIGKFGFASFLGAGVGASIEYFRASPSNIEIIVAAIAGVVVIDELLQAILLHRPRGKVAKPGKPPKPEKPAKPIKPAKPGKPAKPPNQTNP